jgi:hypothetical protein
MEISNLTCDERSVLRGVIDEIEQQFAIKKAERITCPISPRYLKRFTNVSSNKSTLTIKSYLEYKGKTPRYYQSTGSSGSKYIIDISQSEFADWKKELDALPK